MFERLLIPGAQNIDHDGVIFVAELRLGLAVLFTFSRTDQAHQDAAQA
jgi:hypothetical protein